MDSIVGAYVRTRDRVCGLLMAADSDDLQRQVPACPEWRVHELLAHLVSMPAAISMGRRPSGAIGEWLSELIVERHDQAAADLVAQWQALDDRLPGLLSGGSSVLFGDLAVHEHDLRAALNRPDHRALEVGEMLPRTLAAFSKPLSGAGLDAIEVRSSDGVWRSHEGAVGWTLLVDPWTAVRALNSRRTAEELLTLASIGDASPYLPVLDDHLPLPAVSLAED